MQRWEEIAYAREDGKTAGETLKLIKLICKKIEKGKSPEEIAEDLEKEEKFLKNIIVTILDFIF